MSTSHYLHPYIRQEFLLLHANEYGHYIWIDPQERIVFSDHSADQSEAGHPDTPRATDDGALYLDEEALDRAANVSKIDTIIDVPVRVHDPSAGKSSRILMTVEDFHALQAIRAQLHSSKRFQPVTELGDQQGEVAIDRVSGYIARCLPHGDVHYLNTAKSFSNAPGPDEPGPQPLVFIQPERGQHKGTECLVSVDGGTFKKVSDVYTELKRARSASRNNAVATSKASGAPRMR